VSCLVQIIKSFKKNKILSFLLINFTWSSSTCVIILYLTNILLCPLQTLYGILLIYICNVFRKIHKTCKLISIKFLKNKINVVMQPQLGTSLDRFYLMIILYRTIKPIVNNKTMVTYSQKQIGQNLTILLWTKSFNKKLELLLPFDKFSLTEIEWHQLLLVNYGAFHS
jgi:hypothetical protein